MQFVSALIAMSLLAAPAAVEKPRRGCDVSVLFKATRGKIDTQSFDGLTRWLSSSSDITGYEKTDRRDGTVRLCIQTTHPEIRNVFNTVSNRVARSFGGASYVKVENRYGGLFELPRFKGYTQRGNPNQAGHNGRPSRTDLARTPRPN